MSTGVFITLIVCATVLVIFALIVVIAWAAWKKQQNQARHMMDNIHDIFSEKE